MATTMAGVPTTVDPSQRASGGSTVRFAVAAAVIVAVYPLPMNATWRSRYAIGSVGGRQMVHSSRRAGTRPMPPKTSRTVPRQSPDRRS